MYCFDYKEVINFMYICRKNAMEEKWKDVKNNKIWKDITI